MTKGMTATEKSIWTAFNKRKKELKIQIKLLEIEVEGIASQMLDLETEALERTARFKLGDVIEYQVKIGYGQSPKTQTRRAAMLRYRRSFNEVEPFWATIKKDMTLGTRSYYRLWIRDDEMATARKIGTWDFEARKFVPLEE